MNEDLAEQARRTKLIQGAFARGQAALADGEKAEAARWLDRARRLARDDGPITLFLASALLGEDNFKAADLFTRVLASTDARDAWLGLATARFLSGDIEGAATALAGLLARHALRPDVMGLADQIARTTGSAGWSGVTGEGVLVARSLAREPLEARIDGGTLTDGVLPPDWSRARTITATAGGCHLLGSPISVRAIGRVEGFVETSRDGVRGLAWCPGDPDADPRLELQSGDVRVDVETTETLETPPGLPPFARPRSFAISWPALPSGDAPIHIRGRDGRDLTGSPVARDQPAVTTADPPVPSRRRSDLARWRAAATGSVIIVTHDDGGGVERCVQTAVAAHEASERRAVILRPSKPSGVVVEAKGLPGLRFELPGERRVLLRFLKAISPTEVELHHFLNHEPSMLDIIQALDVPYDAYAHDYIWFCPRIALVGRGDRYCGEPPPATCEDCVAELGSYLPEAISVAALLDRSRNVLFAAKRVIAPSRDTAARMTRHFPGLAVQVVPHEDDGAVADPPPIPEVSGTVRVCVAGAIGLHKGYDVLLACARDARKRRLDLTFIVAGTTIDDQRLMDTGRVFVTGPYQPDEAVSLIRAQDATLALLPSIWPETWCLGLTELWRAGLRVAAFDIGAPADRIRRTGRGFLLPLGCAPPTINDALLNAARGRSFLPIRRCSAYKPPSRMQP